MKNLKGTALYCGIGNTIEEMKAHLKEASEAGINFVFSSLQLPESSKEVLLRDFPKMAEIAHSYNMLVDADVSPRTAKAFGIDFHDIKAFKDMGIDIARIDYGYTNEELVEVSHNTCGVIIELNASHVSEEWLQKLIDLGINKEAVRFCYNYYPMRYTGHTVNETLNINKIIHSFGFRVCGFIPSNTHKRIACSIGLPSVERHREMDTHTVIQEMYLFGFDDICFGDDFASKEELNLLTSTDPNVVTIRYRPFIEGDITDWVVGRVMGQTSGWGRAEILRSNYTESYKGYTDDTFSCTRRRGDVTINKSGLLRYSGEIQLVRMDLPRDNNIGIIGRIIDEDLPLLDTFKEYKEFRLVRDVPKKY
ncbi:MAG: DUF871 family protein [Clostridia bacterium]|nr:DUF871 family protein [Clostridia bacterium]